MPGVHTGEWAARNGAACVCGGFECPGVYGGLCPEDLTEKDPCPCGCGAYISRKRRTSYAYDRSGFNWGDDDPKCLAAQWPPDETNAAIFAGQDVLYETGVEGYEYELVACPSAGPDCYNGRLYYQGDLVSRIDVEGMEGEVMAVLHGDMMIHAGRLAAVG